MTQGLGLYAWEVLIEALMALKRFRLVVEVVTLLTL